MSLASSPLREEVDTKWPVGEGFRLKSHPPRLLAQSTLPLKGREMKRYIS
jgi:hypothetical protein